MRNIKPKIISIFILEAAFVAVAYIFGSEMQKASDRTNHIRFDFRIEEREKSELQAKSTNLIEDINKNLIADYLGELELKSNFWWHLRYLAGDPFNNKEDQYYLDLGKQVIQNSPEMHSYSVPVYSH